MVAVRLIALAFSFGPILFGIGFVAPVIMATMQAFGLAAPFGLNPLHFALGLGATLGVIARQRKTWLW